MHIGLILPRTRVTQRHDLPASGRAFSNRNARLQPVSRRKHECKLGIGSSRFIVPSRLTNEPWLIALPK
jgi:hypothetical protein